MTINVMPEVQLSVGLTNPNDDGQGKALLDPKTMLLLNISLGDLVMIEGKRQTVAKFCQTPIQDWNQCKIMIDHFTRFNAGVDIGDTVKVSKISEKILAKVCCSRSSRGNVKNDSKIRQQSSLAQPTHRFSNAEK